VFDPGTVLIVVRSGVLRHTLPVTRLAIRAAINQDVKALIPKTDEFSPPFLAAYLEVKQDDVLAFAVKHSTTVQSVNTDEFVELDVPRPPKPTQELLVAELNAARVTRGEMLAQADTLLASLGTFVLNALGFNLPPPDERAAYAIKLRDARQRFDANYHTPRFRELQRRLKKLGAVPLDSLCHFSNERKDPTSDMKPTFRYIEISSVSSETGEVHAVDTPRSEAPSRARMEVHEGDILVSLTRPQRGSVALVPKDFEGCIASTGFAVLTDIDKDQVEITYLWAFLRTEAGRLQMLQRSSGGNYPAIIEDELQRVLIPIPDRGIQRTIAVEAAHRQATARRLRLEAGRLWNDAKRRFEKELLGPEPSAKALSAYVIERGDKR